jgi:hypothetical protein
MERKKSQHSIKGHQHILRINKETAPTEDWDEDGNNREVQMEG